MMRILFTIGGFGNGGKEGRMAALMEYLAGRGYELGIIASRKSQRLPETARICRFVYDYRVGELCFNVREHFKAVSNFRPHVIHSWNGSCTAYSILAAAGRSCSVVTSEITDARPIRSLSVEHLVTRFNFTFSDSVLANSFAGLKAKKAPGRKSHVIHNGYRFERLQNIEARRYASYGEEHGLKVVMAARFTREKDYSTVVKVAELAQRASLGILFVFAGDGVNRKSVEADAEARGLRNVRFAGHVPDIDNLLHHMDVGILATDTRYHQEGISNSIIECMAHRMPVVMTDGNASAEIVTDGVDGFISKERSAEDLLNKLRILEADRGLLRDMGQNAYLTVRRKFGISEMGSSFAQVYEEVASHSMRKKVGPETTR